MKLFHLAFIDKSALDEIIASGEIAGFAINLLGGIIALIIGLWVAGKIAGALQRVMQKRNADPSLTGFIYSFTGITLKILVVISVLGMIGIQMTSFIAILAAAGLAVGMALSGTLQNFAGGVILLMLKPFKVGEFIEAQGFMGTVNEIQIFNTILTTPDNKKILIPNGGLATNAITNFSARDTRRVQWVFGIAYGDSYAHAKEVISKLIEADDRILADPAPFIALSELNDSSVDITVRAWVKTADFWGVFFDMNEKIYETFGREGINIPFPQMDVHLHQQKQ
jgi:small conductance mechanosensitive channel